MKWRDVFIGFISSLFVTFLGGVGVYYATKEPNNEKKEKLIYNFTQKGDFKGGSQELSLASLVITNSGALSAKNLQIVVVFNNAEIRDITLDDKTKGENLINKKDNKNINIKYINLLPEETITINFLLSKAETPTIDIRSDSSLAEPFHSKNADDLVKTKINLAASKIVPFSTIIMFLATSSLIFYLRKKGVFNSSFDPNNAGFLLLHSGLTNEAESVFARAINIGRYDQFTLSNFALCKALQGEFLKADSLLKAAYFREQSGHSKAVVTFNEAIIKLLQGNKSECAQLIKKAIELSPKAIKHYCQKSVLFDNVRTDPIFHSLWN